YCLTQEASSCVVYGMPKAVVEAHMSDEAHTLEGLAQRINELASQ
ncbi:MAG: chemotaxis protein CheB, partial [Vampirovibrionales bacterium]